MENLECPKCKCRNIFIIHEKDKCLCRDCKYSSRTEKFEDAYARSEGWAEWTGGDNTDNWIADYLENN